MKIKTWKKLFFLTASVTSFLSVLAWYPNTLLRTWCLVLHSLTLMTNMQLNGKGFFVGFLMFTVLLIYKWVLIPSKDFQSIPFVIYILLFSKNFRLFKSELLELLVPWETETLMVKENVIISKLSFSPKKHFRIS